MLSPTTVAVKILCAAQYIVSNRNACFLSFFQLSKNATVSYAFPNIVFSITITIKYFYSTNSITARDALRANVKKVKTGGRCFLGG